MSNEHEALSECNKCGRRYPTAPVGHIHKCGNCPGTCYPLATPSPSTDPLVAPSTDALEGAVKVPTLRQLDKLWANTGGKAWEPKGGTDHPLIAAMIDGGWVKRCVMRCGFEAMDTGLNWTNAARAFFAARNTGGSHD